MVARAEWFLLGVCQRGETGIAFQNKSNVQPFC